MRIKDVVKERGFTVQSLADVLGMNRVTLSNMINGNPTIETLNKIADALGVPVWQLLVSPEEVKEYKCPHCGEPIRISLS